MASETSGNNPLMPVWKTSGSSSFTRYWLKLKSGPPGIWIAQRRLGPCQPRAARPR
jgi:hypothetical protein